MIEGISPYSPEQETEVKEIPERISEALAHEGIPAEKLDSGEIRYQSIAYMTYWFQRLHNNPEEQLRIREHLIKYLGDSIPDSESLSRTLFSNHNFNELSKKYVETIMVPTRTVDLVVTKPGFEDDKDPAVLCTERSYFPLGLSLPGGIIKDSDEDNDLNLTPQVFAALRVAGEKILGLGPKAQYLHGTDQNGKECYIVKGEADQPLVRLYPQDEMGYKYYENIKTVIRPSDPRHIVDTTGFRCEVEGEIQSGLTWKNKSEIMSPENHLGGFAFGHHREIVAHITSQSSVDKERQLKEREFIRGIINNPEESADNLIKRFEAAGNSPDVEFIELFPVVDRIMSEMFTEDVNQLCEQIPLLAGIRDKAVISLRQVSLKHKNFMPYLSTIRAIAESIAFFDIVARQKKGFYDSVPKDKIVEHNPKTTPYASYHMYRYKYRLDEMLGMIPGQIVIPTFESLSATDLLKVRGVPIRFVGISKDFLYVDEFEQSPEEFFMHDCNHSWRMIMEDEEYMKKHNLTREQFLKESNAFIKEYLERIKIRSTDSEEEKEIKKLKKIILFEIVHEDARPFLKDVIGKYIQVKEGGDVPFEVPKIDHETGFMDIVETIDTGISTLSYVRNKLQHGFYDHIDAQLPQIVDPKYRTARWIAKAAYDMLVELNAPPEPGAELDENDHVSIEWLLKRTCAVGPDNIHGEDQEDPDVALYGDGAEALNPKRYQAGE